jgi:hypothetical protein
LHGAPCAAHLQRPAYTRRHPTLLLARSARALIGGTPTRTAMPYKGLLGLLLCVFSAAGVHEIKTENAFADVELWRAASSGVKLLCLHRKAGPPQEFNELAQWAESVGISTATLNCNDISVGEARDALDQPCISGLQLLYHGDMFAYTRGVRSSLFSKRSLMKYDGIHASVADTTEKEKAQQWILDSALKCEHKRWTSLPSPRKGAAVIVASRSLSKWLSVVADPVEDMANREDMRVFLLRALCMFALVSLFQLTTAEAAKPGLCKARSPGSRLGGCCNPDVLMCTRGHCLRSRLVPCVFDPPRAGLWRDVSF